MGNILFSLVAFIFALGILIAVHEFGHYWVARRSGVKVLRFSIGFGRPLFKRIAGPDKTEYVLAAIPLGGYVKMLDEREGEVAEEDLPRAFNRQPLSKRFAIVVAGPLFNFLFAIVAYWAMYIIGVPGVKPIIDQVEESSIAQSAGFMPGDQIVSIDGQQTPTWSVARIKLLSASLDDSVVTVKVQTQNHAQRDIQLNLDSISSEIKDGRILDELGITPPRPQLPAVIGKLIDNGRALASGLKEGDAIVTADGHSVKDWEAWVDYVRARPEQVMLLVIDREGEVHHLELTPARVTLENGDEIGRIGAAPAIPDSIPEELRAEVKYSPAKAFVVACEKTWDMSLLTLRMIGKMLFGEVSLDNLSGPITIAKYAGYTASAGLVTFLAFLAIVSISLGVLNLLPIPLLDGGHLMFYIIELVKGSPLTESYEMIFQRVGLVLLLMLMSVALYNDFARIFN